MASPYDELQKQVADLEQRLRDRALELDRAHRRLVTLEDDRRRLIGLAAWGGARRGTSDPDAEG